jgi:hypothetical protein
MEKFCLITDMLYLEDICQVIKHLDLFEANINIMHISLNEFKIWAYINRENLIYSSMIDKKFEELLKYTIGFVPEYRIWADIKLEDASSIAFIDYSGEAYERLFMEDIISDELLKFVSENIDIYIINIEA